MTTALTMFLGAHAGRIVLCYTNPKGRIIRWAFMAVITVNKIFLLLLFLYFIYLLFISVHILIYITLMKLGCNCWSLMWLVQRRWFYAVEQKFMDSIFCISHIKYGVLYENFFIFVY